MKLFEQDTARESDNVMLFPALLCVNFWAANFTNEHESLMILPWPLLSGNDVEG